jgi:hypothetical protein
MLNDKIKSSIEIKLGKNQGGKEAKIVYMTLLLKMTCLITSCMEWCNKFPPKMAIPSPV